MLSDEQTVITVTVFHPAQDAPRFINHDFSLPFVLYLCACFTCTQLNILKYVIRGRKYRNTSTARAEHVGGARAQLVSRERERERASGADMRLR